VICYNKIYKEKGLINLIKNFNTRKMSLEDKTNELDNVGCLFGVIGAIGGFILGANLADSGAIYQIPVVEYFARFDKFFGVGVVAGGCMWASYYIGAGIHRLFKKK